MFADFFIKRPVFTSVCAIIILLVGAISIPTLPIERYPQISPIQVNVAATYTGASAEVVENTVTTLLEEQINGVEGMQYMSSSSSNNGASAITVTFDSATNQDIAAVDVQNRVSTALPELPQTVQQAGVTVTKQSSSILLAFGLYSDNKEYDPLFLSNYANLYIIDALKRINGVSNATIFGERLYAMRIWIDPIRLASRNLTAQDVINAIQAQNLQVGAGQIGQQPSIPGQMYQIDLQANGRLTDPSQFANIAIATASDGTITKIADIGRVELGAQDYSSFLRFNAKDGVGVGIYPLPKSNALNVAKLVKAEMAKLAQQFPPGMKYRLALDTTSFVTESLSEVLKTLFEAIVLVVIVIFIFLQDWQTTIIPVIVIPLALIGTFAFIKVFSFSINTLSLFGLTLATGLVVDDAIIVVENISRLINADEGKSPRQAASDSMRELSGAIIAIGLVLMAVFVPVAFFPGTTGKIYQQFALTIAFSVGLSVFLALTLSPSLSALLLRHGQGTQGWLAKIFVPVNRSIDWTRRKYVNLLNILIRWQWVVLSVFVTTLIFTGWFYTRVPQAFLPDEDQGYFITVIQGPQGVSLNYTSDLMKKIEAEILKLPEVTDTFAIGGFGFSGSTPNNGIVFSTLKPWGDRTGKNQSVAGILQTLTKSFSTITEAKILPVNPPSIQGLGSFGGFVFELEDRQGNSDLSQMLQVMGQLLGQANKTPGLQAVFTTFAANSPQLNIDIDRNKAQAVQVSVQDILNNLQAYLGSQYVNDFNFLKRTFRVYVQAEPQYRSNPQNIGQLNVRSATNQMVPLSNLVKVTPGTGAQTITHYNLFRSIEIDGSAAPGYSSGQSLQAMQKVATQVLPASFGYDWSGISAEELTSGGQAPIIFGLGVLLVFLVLSAQYENYFDPFIILLSVPLAILGALAGLSLRGLSNDVYSQVGLVMLIGLASKNAILIVEFANQLRERGYSVTQAALEASEERLRPILMTTFAFILGTLPLAIASGAGAASRQSLGTAVVGGMIVSTLLSLFIVPILYIIINGLRDRYIPSRPQEQRQPTEDGKVPSGTPML